MIRKSRTENAIRKRLSRAGYILKKSRKAMSSDNHGEYMLVDANTKYIVHGERFDFSLEEAEEFLKTL